MSIIVDLIRCQRYGHCVIAAPSACRFSGEAAQAMQRGSVRRCNAGTIRFGER
jgi:hypothetical protein